MLKKKSLLISLLFTNFFCFGKKAIFWDLGGVLFRQEKFYMAYNEIGLGKFFWHAIFDRKNPTNIKQRAYEVLYYCGQQEADCDIIRDPEGLELPLIMCQWLDGTKMPHDIMLEVEKAFEELDAQNFFSSDYEKNLLEKVIHVIFNPLILAKYTQPIPKGLELLELCAQNPENEFYILSNWDLTSFGYLCQLKRCKMILDYFKPERTFISGITGYVKPQKEAYTTILNFFGLNPADCIFIDDQEENCKAAAQCGITSIHLRNGNYDTAKKLLVQKGYINNLSVAPA